MSHEVMIPRSAAEGQEVNSRNADEVFPEHAPSKEAEGDTFLVSTCTASVHSQGRTSALAGRSGPRPSAWGADDRDQARFQRSNVLVRRKGTPTSGRCPPCYSYRTLTSPRYAFCTFSKLFNATRSHHTSDGEVLMTSPATILIGGVRRERLDQDLDGPEGILFMKTRGITLFEDRANAVLVVLEPDQNPREVAETILWALR